MAPEIPPGNPSPSERPCERHEDVRDFGGQKVGAGPCVDRDGRVVRHSAYVFPARGNPVVRFSALAAIVLAAVLVGLYFLASPARPDGSSALRSVLAPAPTSSRHSLATVDCAQCHQTRHNVEDARCERCHDPALTARLSNAAHVFQGSSDMARSLSAPVVSCATCHLEHRGAGAALASVDDRECGSCHRADPAGTRLTALTRHPEFALVRDGVESGSGLRWFNHSLHVPKVQAKFQQTCSACHQRKPEAASFSPISFPSHCAPCHEADLADSAGTLAPATLTALGPIPAPLRAREDPDDPARHGVTGIRHADPWVLSTVQALRARISPDGAAADRASLDRQVAQLELLQRFGAGDAAYGSWTGVAPLTDPRSPNAADSPTNGVGVTAAGIDALLSGLAPDPSTTSLRAEAARLQQSVPAPAPAGAAGTADVGQLRQLLAATIARASAAGDEGLGRRAAALVARLDALGPGAQRPIPAGGSSTVVTPLLQDLAMSADPRVRAEARRLNDLAGLSQRQAAGAIDPRAFDLHRRQTLQLLDATGRTLLAQRQAGRAPGGIDAVLARAATLRHRVLSADYAASPQMAASRLTFFRQREIDRARIDTELDRTGQRTAVATEAPDLGQDDTALRLAQLRRQLAAIGAAPRLTTAIAPDEARRAIAALIGTEVTDAEQNALKKNRCTLCHELGAGGDQLAPVRSAGGPLLVRARFTHAPHVNADQANCESCHTGILRSSAARDLNLPGIASCVTCHAPGKQAAKATGCESCHTYHVPSARAMVWTP